MRNLKNNRTAFRPSLNDIRLEDRVVLNGGSGSAAQVATLAAATNPSSQTPQTAAQTLQTRRDLFQVYRTQFRDSENGLKQLLNYETDQVYANGKPSSDQLSGLQGLVNGAVDGTAFRLSSQLALLPVATDNLVAQLQDGMLSSRRTSLASRLDGFINSPRFNQSSQSLKSVINLTLTNFTQQTTRQFTNYLNTSPLFRMSIDSTTGRQIPVQQYMAQQVISQLGASLGSLAKAFPTVANTAIFNSGVISTDPVVQQQFATQLGSAISVVNAQLASNLSVFSGASKALAPQLQQAFFGSGQSGTGTATIGGGTTTGTGGLTGTTVFTDLISSLSNVPTTSSSAFFPAVNTAFNNTFQNVSGTLGTFLNLPASGTTTGLPIDIIPSIGGPVFFGFNNGFNNGFGSGFAGFGQSAVGQNNFLSSGFSNGFYGLTAAQNQQFGFNPVNFTGFGMSGALTGTGITGTDTTGLGTTGTGITGTSTTGLGSIGSLITGTGITGLGTVGTGIPGITGTGTTGTGSTGTGTTG